MTIQRDLPGINRCFTVQFTTKQYPGVPVTTTVEARDDDDRTLIAAINTKLNGTATAKRIVLVMEQQ